MVVEESLLVWMERYLGLVMNLLLLQLKVQVQLSCPQVAQWDGIRLQLFDGDHFTSFMTCFELTGVRLCINLDDGSSGTSSIPLFSKLSTVNACDFRLVSIFCICLVKKLLKSFARSWFDSQGVEEDLGFCPEDYCRC